MQACCVFIRLCNKKWLKIVEAAFAACDSDGDKGLTWAEVKVCKVGILCLDFANISLIFFKFDDLPNEANFNWFDMDGNGILLIKEWKEKSNCQEKTSKNKH